MEALIFFEGRANLLFQEIKQNCLKRISEKRIVEMFDNTPRRNIACTAFRDQDVDMGIPLKASTESVQYANESRGKIFGFVDFTKHIQDGLTNSIKKTVQKIPVFSKKYAKFFWDCENTMPVGSRN